MNRRALEARLRELLEQRAGFAARYATAASMEELDALDLELRRVESEIGVTRSALDAIPEDDGEEGGDGSAAAQGETTPLPISQRGLNPLASYSYRGAQLASQNQADEDGDVFSTLEYRRAFMNYVVSGTPIPEEYRQAMTENRAAEFSLVTDVTAVIPTNLMNRAVEDLTVEGKILNLVTQTNYQGGVSMPIDEINPTVSWLGADEAVSAEQKAEMKASVTFAYHILEARIAIGILAATVALSVFENQIVKKIKSAVIRELEKCIISGDGSGKPKGITTYAVPSSQVVTMSAEQVGTVSAWASMEAALPEAYEANAVYMMNKATWELYLNGMTDTTGQKIGLGKINEKGQKILNGRLVVTTDTLPAYDTCGASGVFAALCDLSQYILNSNLNMYYKKYFDENDNKYKHKVLMIVDGKMAAGNNSKGELVGAKHLILAKKAV